MIQCIEWLETFVLRKEVHTQWIPAESFLVIMSSLANSFGKLRGIVQKPTSYYYHATVITKHNGPVTLQLNLYLAMKLSEGLFWYGLHV